MATAPGKDLVMAIDQGTSSSRALVFDATAAVVAGAQLEFPQIFPGPGWVEHDPEAIWQSVSVVCKETAAKVDARRIAGLGITNQRETTFVWNRDSGKCIHNAIVWQDRRTADRCQRLIDDGHEDLVRSKTGLRLDPYFSATKLGWVLENVSGARKLAEQGKLAFGTADSFLLWRLTGGKCHATDATNASRTLLFNIHDQSWDEELLRLFDIPPGILPEVRDCADDYGMTDPSMLGVSVPIGGVAGDQHAALIGQAAFDPGVTKSTYGTGCFVMTNTGAVALTSRNNLLTTVAYRLQGKTTYGIEGSIFVAGSAIQWLRDKLGIIKSADATEALAVATGPVEDIHVVPAFAGLGAPYWGAAACRRRSAVSG